MFFGFTAGLAQTLTIEKGTKERLKKHVDDLERALKIVREKYKENNVSWAYSRYEDISDEVLCTWAKTHDWYIEWFYNHLSKCSKNPPKDGEELTPEEFAYLLPALSTPIRVPTDRWSNDYYEAKMKIVYEVLRGRPTGGITFDNKKLTEKQAAQVIIIFSEWLDKGDIRLNVPKGRDELARYDQGGYEWCEKCGPITYEDSLECKRKKCPLLAEYKAEREG